MSMRKVLIVVTIGFLTGGEQFLAAAEPCTIEPVSDAQVAKRAKQIRFPDGRVITLIGDQHSDKNAVKSEFNSADNFAGASAADLKEMVTESLADGSAKPITEVNQVPSEDNLAELEKAMGVPAGSLGKPALANIDDPGTAVDNFRADEIYLRAQLSADKERPEFVGVESKDAASLAKEKQTYLAFKSQFDSRRSELKMSDNDMNDFIRINSTAAQHIYYGNPEFEKTVPLVATGESDDLDEKHAPSPEVQKSLETAMPFILEHIKGMTEEQKKATMLELVGTIKTALKLAALLPTRYADYESGDAVAAELSKTFPAWLREKGEPVAILASAIAGSFIEQDRKTAQALAAQNKSGIQFVDFDRLNGVTNRLSTICKMEMNGSQSRPVAAPVLAAPAATAAPIAN